jgi:hypothetical protein
MRNPLDRRRIRSDEPDIAVDMQLSHIAHVLNLDALVLADDMGQAVSQIGDTEIGELLAAMVMWSSVTGEVDELTIEALQERDPTIKRTHVTRVSVDIPGEANRLELVALGRSIVTSIGLAHAAEGIRRIRTKRN